MAARQASALATVHYCEHMKLSELHETQQLHQGTKGCTK